MDKYSDFKTLATNEILNQDYRIRIQNLESDITIIAPHGGLIEPRTSLITELIAGDTYNYYCFEGIKEKNNQNLHITSHKFDEPEALNLIFSSKIIISIHACKDKEKIIYIGGRFKELASYIKGALESLNIKILKKERFLGTHPNNICNKGKKNKGIQLEISRGIRDDLKKLSSISTAIQNVLNSVLIKEAAMTDNMIRLERKKKIAIVTMDRPEKKNAFDGSMFKALEQVTRELEQDLPRAVVLTGGGDKAFCAGFDVNLENPMAAEFLDAVNKKDTALAGKVIQHIRRAVDGFVCLPVPVIAGINGLAYGGGAELAIRCDLRVMDIGARLCFSEVRLGLMPDWGGGACLARLVGPAHAADLILTARVVKAEEAASIGLINRVSDKGHCLDDAMNLAEQISRNGPKAISHALSVLRQSRDLPLKAALDKEAEVAAKLIASGECIHGIKAFMEKKDPRFPD